MTTPDPQDGSGFGRSTALLLMLLFYTLSTGPLAWLEFHGFIPEAVTLPMQAFYSPLRFLYTHFEPISGFFEWYFSLFDVPA